jgi:type VI secretion system secreted protein VgrG
MALNVTLAFPTSADASAVVAGGLLVQRFELREAMSELFELTLDVLSTDPAIAESAIVGQPVVIDFGDEPFLKQIQGIVRAMVQHTAVPTGASRYEWVVVPPIWLTTRRRDHRIFQHLSVPEIVEAVLVDPTYAGRVPLPASRLTGTFNAREYCVQYGETDWDFLSRILADEGIASFFDHAAGSAFTLIDDTTIAAPRLASPVPFSDPSNQNPIVLASPDAPHVQTVVITSKVETSAVTLRDYDFEKPEFILEARKAIAPGAAFHNEAALESYGFEVGAFTLQTPGDQRALATLEAARRGHRRLACTASFALSPGTVMSLVDHPRHELSADFLVVRAHAIADFGKRTVREIELMDHRERFRPARRSKALIHGTQTAIVVGAAGEEIDVDRYGRVEVEFRWDRRDQHSGGSSRRVRVAQGWAGAGFGFVMLPRVNEEVIVAYLEGDPDQPIIVGRVHNAFVTSPLSLPAEKTVSAWRSRSSPGGNGYNEIRMDDQAGAERFDVHAQRDFQLVVERHLAQNVVGNARQAVAGDCSMSADKDTTICTKGTLSLHGDSYVELTSNSELAIRAPTHIDLAKSRSIGADDIRIVGKNIVLETPSGGSSIRITSGGIEIRSDGDIVVNGAVVKLNCE